jgi:hypothetical protein
MGCFGNRGHNKKAGFYQNSENAAVKIKIIGITGLLRQNKSGTFVPPVLAARVYF